MKLHEKLRRLRLAHGHTLAAVRAGTGLSISFLSDLEQGRSQPSLDSLAALAGFYGQTVLEFLADIDLGQPAPRRKSPPGFEEFLAEQPVPPDQHALLLHLLLYTRKRPRTAAEWRQFYYALTMLLGL